MDPVVIFMLIFLILLSISAGVAVWKRNALFGKGIGKTCKENDFIGCKPGTECSSAGTCLVPENKKCKEDSDCMDLLTCTENICTPRKDPVNCSGEWKPINTTCIVNSGLENECGNNIPGKKLNSFNIYTHAENGGASCDTNPDSLQNVTSAYTECTINRVCPSGQAPYNATKTDYCTVTIDSCLKNANQPTCGSVDGTKKRTYTRVLSDAPTIPMGVVLCPSAMTGNNYLSYSQNLACEYTQPACLTNSIRTDHKRTQGFGLGTSNGVRIVKLDSTNGSMQCLRVKNGDETVKENDEVEFGDCEANNIKDSTWYVDNEKIKTIWDTSLCLDYNFHESNNKKFKVTKCNGSPNTNRDFRINWHDKVVWDKDIRLLTNQAEVNKYNTQFRPVRIRNTSDGLCVSDPNNKTTTNSRNPCGRACHQLYLCPGCMRSCSTDSTQWYLHKPPTTS